MKPDYDYNQESLTAAFRAAGIEKGDTVFIHISMGRLGRLQGGTTQERINEVLMGSLTESVGTTGTILVPTYTYSIGRREVFDVQGTPSTVGPFTEYFRTLPGSVRSREPMLAVNGIGPRAAELFHDLPRTCFGEGCVYDRLRGIGAKLCVLGVGLYWATFRHHIEEMAEVPFRFSKKFRGTIRDHGKEVEEEWAYYAAPFLPNCQPNGIPLEKKIREEKVCRTAAVGRSEVLVIGAREYFDFGYRELKRDPWFTAVGPACGAKEMEAARNAKPANQQ